MKLCRHCKANKVNRPRGLCWHCYYTPTVRKLYPSFARNAPKESGWEQYRKTPPTESTDARPGTEEKIRVLEDRVARGEYLFHPDDVSCLAWDDRLDADKPH